MIEGDLFQDSGVPEKIDIKAVLTNYLQYWYLFAIGIIICLSIAFFRIRYTIPQYIVHATILIKDDGNGSGLSTNAAFSDLNMFQSWKNIDNEIIMLKSKNLMKHVLKELSFDVSYHKEGRVNDVEIYGSNLPLKLIVNKLEPRAFGKTIFLYLKNNNSFELEEENSEGKLIKSSHKFGQQIKKEYGIFTVVESTGAASLKANQKITIKFHDIHDLASHYSNKLSIAPVKNNVSVLKVSLTDPVEEKGIDIITKLIEVYEKEAVGDKNLIVSNTLHFIDERLKYLSAELTDVEKNVELYKQQNDLTDVGSEAQLFLNSASEYNRQLADYDIQLEILKSIENYLQKQGNQFDIVPSSLNIQDPTLISLISKFNELHLERQRMLRTTQQDNPLIVNLNEQLVNLRINIGENLRNIKNGLIITRQSLLSNSAKFESRKRQVPALERELIEINRQQGVKANLYLYLLQKREESALSLAATVSNSRIIDAPSAGSPIGPNKPMIYMIALLVGLGVPFAGLYVKDLLNDKVQQLKDIEKVTATPIIGELTRNKTAQTVVVMQGKTNTIVEMFRLIRTNLQFATVGKENKVVLITSSMGGEGKTFFSINLAASLVMTGKKVVILGFDLRKPTLLKALNLSDGLGITNYLISNSISVNDIVRSSHAVPDLYIISSGPIPPNPTELMMSPKVEKLLNILKESFDHIIIDTAPIGQVADAFTLARYIDSTIYIVRSNYTHKAQISIIDKIYKEKKLSHPMIVLNDTKKGNNYGYGYGYDYSIKKNRKSFFQKA